MKKNFDTVIRKWHDAVAEHYAAKADREAFADRKKLSSLSGDFDPRGEQKIIRHLESQLELDSPREHFNRCAPDLTAVRELLITEIEKAKAAFAELERATTEPGPTP